MMQKCQNNCLVCVSRKLVLGSAEKVRQVRSASPAVSLGSAPSSRSAAAQYTSRAPAAAIFSECSQLGGGSGALSRGAMPSRPSPPTGAGPQVIRLVDLWRVGCGFCVRGGPAGSRLRQSRVTAPLAWLGWDREHLVVPARPRTCTPGSDPGARLGGPGGRAGRRTGQAPGVSRGFPRWGRRGCRR
jgi:hypothetical protein